MNDFFGSAWWLIVSIGILVTFHEFGHFWVARRFGVYVLRFSVGFGRPLFKRVGRDGTEFVVAMIPLGGYVKMLDEHEFEVDPVDLHRAFNRKPVWQRMAIAAAGPAANFLLCFALFWTVFVIGLPDYQPIVGHVSGVASQAGFVPGDRLIRVGDESVQTWTDAAIVLASAAMDRKPVQVEVLREDGGRAVRSLPLQQLGSGLDDSDALGEIGLFPKQFELPPIVGDVTPGKVPSPLRPGDRILAINGASISYFGEMSARVRAEARAGTPLHLTIERNHQRLQIDVIPRMGDPGDGKPRLLIGVSPQPSTAEFDGLRRYGPIEALAASGVEMRRQTEATFGMLRRIFAEGAVQGLHGFVGIAVVAQASARQGLAWFLFFLGMLSLSLGIINLLPVPILDGGHLLYYLIELVKGSPVSERSLAVGQYIGLTLLGGLMCVAFYNDVFRHVF